MEKISWEKIYNEFTAPVTDYDCGLLCAPGNQGIPVCCDNDQELPVLFTEELKWLNGRTKLWKQMAIKTKEDKKMADEIEDYIKYCHCNGIAECGRRYRSLACRFFPFEPYMDIKGRFAGITWIYRAEKECPLISKRGVKINQNFINQFIDVWDLLFKVYPGEFELYSEESKKLRRRFKKYNRTIKIFKKF
ncbi:MAG: hypothetical protein ABIA63_06275 [bacterium]